MDLLLLLACVPLVSSSVPADLAMNSYNNAFYRVDKGVGYFHVDSSGGVPDRQHFWKVCEQVEVIEDAFQRSKEPVYGGMIGELLNGLNQVVSGTSDWASWNQYNDDILWGVIALVRSFLLTGTQAHLTQAEQQFNAVWARAWDTKQGGLYWNTSRVTKNACVNGPGAIAGFLLGKATGQASYTSQGQQALSWLRSRLFNASTGQVYDHVDPDGTLTKWAFTYNQGTFIGASTLFSQLNSTAAQLDKNTLNSAASLADAQLAAVWAQKYLTGEHAPGILNDEYDSSHGGEGDGVGFKGIFARWCAEYIRVSKDQAIASWLSANNDAAWNNRNTKGVTWAQWWHRTPDSTVTSWETSSAAAISQT